MNKGCYLIVFLVLLFIKCAKDDPTSPDIPDETPIATETIGSAGGTLETADFKLTVPAGAFDEAAELKLYIDETSTPGENNVTPIYRIEGMPEYYDEPLEISVRYQGTLEDLTFAQRGRETEMGDVDTTFTGIFYEHFEATEDNGFLTAEFPAIPASANGAAAKRMTTFKPRKWYISYRDGCSLMTSYHFHLKSSELDFNANPTFYQTIANYLEMAFNRIRALNFQVGETETFTCDIMYKADASRPFKLVTDFLGEGFNILMSENPNIDDYRDEFDYVFLRMWLSRNDQLYADWPLEGFCQWTRYLHKDAELDNEVYDAFYRPLTSSLSKGHYALIEYLVDIYGDALLSNVFNDMMPPKSESGRTALQDHTASANVWFNDYYLSLLTSTKWKSRLENKTDIYPTYYRDIADSETIIEGSTTLLEWKRTYDDLSARLLRIELASDLHENSSLNFELTGGNAKMTLLKFKNNTFEHISTAETTCNLSGIKQLADDGYLVYVMIARGVSGVSKRMSSEITLDIEHVRAIVGASMALRNLDAEYLTTYKTGGTLTEYYTFSAGFFKGDNASTSFSNNVFSQSHNFTGSDGIYYTGHISLEFDESMENVQSFLAESTMRKDDRYYGYFTETKIRGHSIPRTGDKKYSFEGLGTLAKVTSVFYHKIWTSDSTIIEVKSIIGDNADTEIEINIF